MYCRKLKNGKWSCTADASPDPITGKRRQVTRRGNTKKEAQQRTRERVKELNAEDAATADLTFLDVYEEWWEIYKTTVKPSTLHTKAKNSKKVIDRFGHSPIKEIHPREIQLFLNELAQIHSSNYIRNIKGIMNQVFNYAIRIEILDKSPLKNILMPKGVKSSQQRRYLEKGEIQKVLSVAKERNYQHYTMFYCQLSTGMRAGEMLALKWDDVDFEARILNVNKTIFHSNAKHWELLSPKTKSSERVILIDDHLVEILKIYKSIQNSLRLKNPRSSWENNFIFSNLNSGEPISTKYLSDIYNPYYKKVGIKGISGTHILRHTHITLLIESGVDVKSTMDRVGHDKIDTTLEIYSHVTNKMREKGLEKVNEILVDIRENI